MLVKTSLETLKHNYQLGFVTSIQLLIEPNNLGSNVLRLEYGNSGNQGPFNVQSQNYLINAQ